MPFINWITNKLKTDKEKQELFNDATIVLFDNVERPLEKMPESILIKLLDEAATECGNRGVDLVKIYGGDSSIEEKPSCKPRKITRKST